jgi:hypothetical protein
MNHFFSVLSIFIILDSLSAQPNIEWQKCYGGSQYDAASNIQQTNDGGYIVTGLTQSYNGDVSGNHGVVDVWALKLSSDGSVEWQKALGGSSVEVGTCVLQTLDGGYILSGFSISNDGDVAGNHGESDFWLVKLNSSGEIQWQKALGGSKEEEAQCIRQTNDGGYIVVGYSNSNDGDVTGNHGYSDYWVVKLNESGEIEWQKSLGGTGNDEAYSVQLTKDGGYIVAGSTFSNNGDVSGNHGNVDYWVVKLDSEGEIEWQKAFGGSGADYGGMVCQTSDGGYIVAGTTGSIDGQVSGAYGYGDGWVIKLDQTGTLQWQKVLGGSDQDGASSIFQTSDGGLVLSLSTTSNDGDVLNNDGGADIWVVKLSGIGNILWQKTLGGSQAEVPGGLQPTLDGGYILCGYTESNDGDVSGNQGNQDFWIVKLSPESSPTFSPETQALEIYPNPAQQSISLNIAAQEPALTVYISDLLGHRISFKTSINGQNIDITTLPIGLFLVTATTTEGNVFSGKFIKQE